MITGPIASQLGPRSLAANDARFKLDRIHQSEFVERQGAPGPMCFGPRIMGDVGGMTPGRVNRLERYKDYDWLYAG
jgi:hypothetical protein